MSVDLNKLKQSNDELKEIVNNSWDGIGIIDKDSKFIYANNAFSPILGYPKEEILKSYFTSFINVDYIRIFDELIRHNLENRYSSDAQIICNRKDGKKVYLQISLSLMLNKTFFVINAKDITKQISDHEILDKYVISSHTDLNGIITDVSEAFCYVSGYSKSELIGKPHSIVGEKNKDKAFFSNMWQTIKSGNEWGGIIKNIKKSGIAYWIDSKIKPIYNKYGDIVGFTALMFDITNQINLESKVVEQYEDIKQKDKILIQQSKLAIMAETLQLIAHEWRQPISIISLQSQKLAMEYYLGHNPSEEKTIDTLNQIKEKAEELSKIIGDFQNFVELKGALKLSNPNEIVEKAITLFSADSSTHKIKLDFKSITDKSFMTYPNEFVNVILNILINSKEAIEKNNIPNGTINIVLSDKDNEIILEISDNGLGIDETIMDKIFEPYFSTKELQHGVGLGLYMCKIVIDIHLEGRISVQNIKNGVKFTISIPIKEVL